MSTNAYPSHEDEILFEKLKFFIEPIKDLAIILDLDFYRKGITQTYVFEIGTDEHDQFINAYMCFNKRAFIQYVSARKTFVSMYSRNFSFYFDLEINELTEYVDSNVRPYFINRDIRQQAELLVYELNHPKPEKPDC